MVSFTMFFLLVAANQPPQVAVYDAPGVPGGKIAVVVDPDKMKVKDPHVPRVIIRR